MRIATFFCIASAGIFHAAAQYYDNGYQHNGYQQGYHQQPAYGQEHYSQEYSKGGYEQEYSKGYEPAYSKGYEEPYAPQKEYVSKETYVDPGAKSYGKVYSDPSKKLFDQFWDNSELCSAEFDLTACLLNCNSRHTFFNERRLAQCTINFVRGLCGTLQSTRTGYYDNGYVKLKEDNCPTAAYADSLLVFNRLVRDLDLYLALGPSVERWTFTTIAVSVSAARNNADCVITALFNYLNQCATSKFISDKDIQCVHEYLEDPECAFASEPSDGWHLPFLVQRYGREGTEEAVKLLKKHYHVTDVNQMIPELRRILEDLSDEGAHGFHFVEAVYDKYRHEANVNVCPDNFLTMNHYFMEDGFEGLPEESVYFHFPINETVDYTPEQEGDVVPETVTVSRDPITDYKEIWDTCEDYFEMTKAVYNATDEETKLPNRCFSINGYDIHKIDQGISNHIYYEEIDKVSMTQSQCYKASWAESHTCASHLTEWRMRVSCCKSYASIVEESKPKHYGKTSYKAGYETHYPYEVVLLKGDKENYYVDEAYAQDPYAQDPYAQDPYAQQYHEPQYTQEKGYTQEYHEPQYTQEKGYTQEYHEPKGYTQEKGYSDQIHYKGQEPPKYDSYKFQDAPDYFVRKITAKHLVYEHTVLSNSVYGVLAGPAGELDAAKAIGATRPQNVVNEVDAFIEALGDKCDELLEKDIPGYFGKKVIKFCEKVAAAEAQIAAHDAANPPPTALLQDDYDQGSDRYEYTLWSRPSYVDQDEAGRYACNALHIDLNFTSIVPIISGRCFPQACVLSQLAACVDEPNAYYSKDTGYDYVTQGAKGGYSDAWRYEKDSAEVTYHDTNWVPQGGAYGGHAGHAGYGGYGAGYGAEYGAGYGYHNEGQQAGYQGAQPAGQYGGYEPYKMLLADKSSTSNVAAFAAIGFVAGIAVIAIAQTVFSRRASTSGPQHLV